MQSPTRFLITGGAGFIGSHLAEALLEQGHVVAVVDDLSTGRLENIAHLLPHERFHFARASITDAIVMDRLASQSDVIVHLAAAVGVKLIVEHPVHTIETNIMGTEAVLKSALRYGCRTLIASTSEVYGKGSKVPFAEEDDVLLGPTSRSRWAYAASKMVDEFLGLAYQREFGLPVVIMRFFNTVGPRQTGRYGMVIPRFVRQALRGEPITVYGDGEQSRCFCDVSDVVQAIIGLAFHPDAPGRVYNIGSTEETTINALAQRVRALAESQSPIVHIPYEQAYAEGFEDMQRRVPDITRIHTLLGWSPKLGLDDILRRVIAYERERLHA
ncbi:MAG: NAD-dependent epimerase/dehydratase family protein [Ardenticatenia bacterium]|uniref:Nucleoside-diphosphate sugar epimerase n=1 Tax=Ardenticatena maritima TaxID=872965 RepID=A0A0M9UCJ2_9CHLR|nr:GDP-mannose 4,6-dehydratase [Ardenticatena maritima]KPL89211.1 nucleoside-diphosphate sugar epimerase [Ardenticatena maritima]RME09568.1 MAG: NAD-dependent epimerase/dehydratase family protein [Ardenticatenia bacterium]GAP62897.1 UDP-glucose 4-epimerase [Ardenticatena maritima]